jgi:hypothetical protein
MNLKSILSRYSVKPKSLFNKIFITLLFAYIPFLLLFTILAGFGIMPVNFNNENVYGVKAIIVLICFTPFIVLMFSAFGYLSFIFGNFIIKIFIALLPEKNKSK